MSLDQSPKTVREQRKEKQAARRRNLLVLVAVLILVGGAAALFFVFRGGSAPAGPQTVNNPADPVEGIVVITTDSGLQYQELKAGSGPAAQEGNTVFVHYTGWLTDGKKFDSSLDRGTPFEFTLGRGGVIQGWEEGVAGMQVGGMRKLIIPAELAYGERSIGDLIPANSVLVFDVELVEIR
jgi:FKBP-type peptidyl-prolyl cis-trans isomerase FkpA